MSLAASPHATRPETGADRLLEVIERKREYLKAVFYRSRIPPQDAEDLLQELALAVLLKLSEIEDLEAYVVGTARLLCRVYHKKKRKEEEVCDLHARERSIVYPDRSAEDLQVFLEARRALRYMPRQYRRIVVLRMVGFSSSEVARRTGYSSNSIRKLSERGLALSAWLSRPKASNAAWELRIVGSLGRRAG